MIRIFPVFVLILFTTSCNSDRNSDATEKIQFNQAQYINAWVEMWNTYDLDRVDELFLQDDRLTYFSSEKEGTIKGIEEVREHHRGFGFVEGGKEQVSKLWVEDVNTSDFSKAVVITAIWYFQRADSTLQKGPMTVVYVESEGEYKIVHMNFGNYLENGIR